MFGDQCGSRTVYSSMKVYDNKSLSWPREGLEIRHETQLSRAQIDNGGRIARSVKHRIDNQKVQG